MQNRSRLALLWVVWQIWLLVDSDLLAMSGTVGVE